MLVTPTAPPSLSPLHARGYKLCPAVGLLSVLARHGRWEWERSFYFYLFFSHTKEKLKNDHMHGGVWSHAPSVLDFPRLADSETTLVLLVLEMVNASGSARDSHPHPADHTFFLSTPYASIPRFR